MNDKLQELTQKIYNEGLEKGRKEADEIVENAKRDADRILNEARKQAEELREKAAKEAEELKKNVQSELAISARQSVTAIKQRITDLVSDKAVKDALGKAFDDKEFIKEMIIKLVNNWGDIEKSDKDVVVFLSKEDHKKLEDALMAKAAKNIDGSLEIEFEEGIRSGFKIGPKDGSYKISFTEKDFERFFKQYLRPRTQKLFSEEKQEQ
ncbi:MAG: V-type ATP synthase subunit E family protein [Bacteroidales bacterium]